MPAAGRCFPAGCYCKRTAGERVAGRRRRAGTRVGPAPPASAGWRSGAEVRRGRRLPFPFLAALFLSRHPAGRCGAERGGSHGRRPRGSGRAPVAAMEGPGGLRRARRLCHWGPLVALAVVAVCSATAMADAALWYWPLDTAGGSVNFIMLLNWTVMILYNYFSAMFVGPGYVPLGWTPVSAGSRSPSRGGVGEVRCGAGEPTGLPCWRGWPLGKLARAPRVFWCHRSTLLPLPKCSQPIGPLRSPSLSALLVLLLLRPMPSRPYLPVNADLGLKGNVFS